MGCRTWKPMWSESNFQVLKYLLPKFLKYTPLLYFGLALYGLILRRTSGYSQILISQDESVR